VARGPSQYTPQGVIKTDRILKFDRSIRSLWNLQRKFKSSDPLYEIPFRISAHDMPLLRRKRSLNRKIALLAKMTFPSSGTLLRSLAKPASLPMTL